jgi:hypothetical protein
LPPNHSEEDTQVGLIVALQIYQDLFLDVSSAFVFIHGGVGDWVRWMLLSEDVGSEVVVLLLFLGFVDGMRRILV